MAAPEILKYTLAQYSGASGPGLIYLYGVSNKHIGNAYFMHDGDLPSPSQNADGFVSLYFYDTAFPAVVDILRNEKPCYLRWYTSSGAICTTAEPVGEGEFSL